MEITASCHGQLALSSGHRECIPSYCSLPFIFAVEQIPVAVLQLGFRNLTRLLVDVLTSSLGREGVLDVLLEAVGCCFAWLGALGAAAAA